MSSEIKKPNYLMRAVIIFVVAVLIIINIFLIYSTNNLMKEIDSLNGELTAERLKTENLRQRMERDLTDEEQLIEEVKDLDYRNPDDINIQPDLPNT